MTRSLAPLALALLLAGCAGPRLPHLSFTGQAKPAPAPAAPLPPALPGGLCAELLPQPDAERDPRYAGIAFVLPLTPAESAAFAIAMAYVHDLAVWGRAGWRRAADAQAACGAAK